MKGSAEGVNDSTNESFNYDGQLSATRHNKFNFLSNPSAQPLLLFAATRGSKGKVIRKSSAQASRSYMMNKRIRDLINKGECNHSFEEQVISLVQSVLEQKLMSSRKLDALVASALYLVYRLNKSKILLSHLLKTYNLRSSEISKCLFIFKDIGLTSEKDPKIWLSLYEQLVDRWFPSGCYYLPEKKIKIQQDFSFQPSPFLKENLLDIIPDKNKQPEEEKTRDTMLQIGKSLLEIPEVKFAKQGKKPQTVIAGLFLVAAEYCGTNIQYKELADELELSTSTIKQSKRKFEEILLKCSEEKYKFEENAQLIKQIIEKLKSNKEEQVVDLSNKLGKRTR